MTHRENQDQLELGRTLAVLATRIDLSRTEQFGQIDAVEQDFLQRFANNPQLQQETKRRVAEAKFNAAHDRHEPIDLCEKLFASLILLGFTNLEKKANVYLAFVRRLLAEGNTAQARGILSELRRELEISLQQMPSLVHGEQLRICVELLSRTTQ